MEKFKFTVTCKNKHDYQAKQSLIKFYDGLSPEKQIKFDELIKSLGKLLNEK